MAKRTTGEVLAAARERAALTQEQIAQALQRPQSWVSRLETGAVALRVRDMRRVARAYRIRPTDLIPS